MRLALFKPLCAVVFLLMDVYNRRSDAKHKRLMAQIKVRQARLKGKHLKLSPEERAELMALGTKLNHRVEDCFLIATYKTYRRWLRKKATGKNPGRVGRKRVCSNIAELVLRIAKSLWT